MFRKQARQQRETESIFGIKRQNGRGELRPVGFDPFIDPFQVFRKNQSKQKLKFLESLNWNRSQFLKSRLEKKHITGRDINSIL